VVREAFLLDVDPKTILRLFAILIWLVILALGSKPIWAYLRRPSLQTKLPEKIQLAAIVVALIFISVILYGFIYWHLLMTFYNLGIIHTPESL